MKSISSLVLLISLFLFTNCSDEEAESRKRGQRSTIVSLFMAGFFKPNYCSAPEILLEEGKVYNITLEPGKRFWFAYSVTPEFQESSKKIKLSITRVDGIKIDNINIPCQVPSNESNNTRVPTINLPNQLEFQISDISRYDSAGLNTGQVLRSNETTNITLKYDIFE